MRSTKRYSAAGRAGCVQARRARSTGTEVSVYRCDQAALDTDGGPWATVCEDHGAICNHEQLATALGHASAPEGWCEECGSQQTPSPIPLPFGFAEGSGARDDRGREGCMRCGRPVDPERGCEVHVHDGGSVILAASDDANERDEAADLGLWVVGPECMRHVPKAYRRPRTAVTPASTIKAER